MFCFLPFDVDKIFANSIEDDFIYGDNLTGIVPEKYYPGATIFLVVNSKEIQRAITDKDGKLTMNIEKQKAGTKSSIYSKTAQGVVSEITRIIVEDKTAQSLTARKISDKNLYINGKIEKVKWGLFILYKKVKSRFNN